MSATNLWITYAKPNPKASLRLFCLPYAGAGTSIFRTWPNHLPPDIEVCLVQLPGREMRLIEPPFTQLLPLVQTLAQQLLPYLDRPFALFGHSVGALISFELTCQLRRQNYPNPVHLFVSGRRAPQILDPDPPISQLPDAEFVEELRRYNGTPEAVLQNAELMQLFLPVLRADLGINETYVCTNEAPVDCPISAFGGLQDTRVSRDLLAAWQEQTNSSFTLRMFPGEHFFLIKKERYELLSAISQELRKSEG